MAPENTVRTTHKTQTQTMNDTAPSPLKKLFPSIVYTDVSDLEYSVKCMEEGIKSAKRKIQQAIQTEQEQPAKRKKIEFIQVNIDALKNQEKPSVKRRVKWPITHDDFKAMNKKTQDTFLLTTIDSMIPTNNKKGYRVVWMNGKENLQSFYKVGKYRLDRLAASVWKAKDTKSNHSTFVTELAEHGNKGKKPAHAISDSFIYHLRRFIKTLDTEPISEKKDIQVMSPDTDRRALYGEFMEYLSNEGITESCGYSTFLKKIKEFCPSFGRMH